MSRLDGQRVKCVLVSVQVENGLNEINISSLFPLYSNKNCDTHMLRAFVNNVPDYCN